MNQWVSRQQVAAEFLGTFTLVFCGTGAVVIDAVTHGAVTHVGIALTFGLVIASLIYAFGHVSGAHFNPAVTIGMCIAKRFSGANVVFYLLSQIAGALAGSVLLRVLFSNEACLGATLPLGGNELQSFVLEAVLTFILMLVILCVTSGPKEVGIMAGLAIGGIIGLEALFAGPISGASMNPARSLAPALVSGNLTSLWVYLTAPVLGALLAVPAARLTSA
jgi:aquaporin Z